MKQLHSTLLNQARQNQVHGDAGKALALLKQLLKVSGSDQDVQALAYFELGRVYLETDQDDLALKCFNKAIGLSPSCVLREKKWLEALKHTPKIRLYDGIMESYARSETEPITEVMQESSCGYADQESGRLKGGYDHGTEDGGVVPVSYAGFWRRVLAGLLDALLIGSTTVTLAFLLYMLSGTFLVLLLGEDGIFAAGLMGTVALYLTGPLLLFLALWLYSALMESSRHEGTLGKIIVGIHVTDVDGRHIGFGRASGRYFLKILFCSFLPVGIVGCCMAAWTEKKQALHDMPVSCLVICR